MSKNARSEGDGVYAVSYTHLDVYKRQAIYSIVDDDKEMDAVAAIFTDMLEDIELEKE